MRDEIHTFVGPHFTRKELECHCGCGALPKTLLMEKMRAIRERLGVPLHPTSVMRCPDHNEKVARTGRSGPHTRGLAVDFSADAKLRFELIALAIELDATGIFLYHDKNIIHIDFCNDEPGLPRPAAGSY